MLHRLWRAVIDALSLLILSPFLLVGLLAGLFVTLLFWIGAALMIGYLAGRKNLDA